MRVERRAEGRRNEANEGSETCALWTRIAGATIAVVAPGVRVGRSGAAAVSRERRAQAGFAVLLKESDVRDADYRILQLRGCCVQPPDAENRTSGGVGGWRGAIPASQPDFGAFIP